MPPAHQSPSIAVPQVALNVWRIAADRAADRAAADLFAVRRQYGAGRNFEADQKIARMIDRASS